jgi:phenylacetate-CoA ligase
MMVPGEWMRRAGFWALDFLTGSKVRSHYADIKNMLENGTDADISKKHADYLTGMLKYATENVEFYRQFKAFDSLKSFPVINKNIIKDRYDAFQSPEFQRADVVLLHTSGSTGTPFVVRQDKNKRKRVHAEMMYFWGKAGYQIGMRYVFFRIWTSFNRRSRLSAWARNLIMQDAGRQDEEYAEMMRSILRSDRKIKMIIGFPSFLENLADHILARGDPPYMYHVKTIIAYAEALPERAREKLSKAFHCNIVSLYSNQENGMLAQECVENQEFHVNSASYHIELLKLDSDAPVRAGKPGRIVVTDLFNHAMPLIRYDTGDIGIWKKAAKCGWNSQVLSSIEGRMYDLIFDTQGNRFSPNTICMYMWPFDRLAQFQFVQAGAKQYILKLNGAEGFYEDATFVELFKGVLGQDAEISVEHVDEIPVLASGKRRTIVSNMSNEKPGWDCSENRGG